MLLTKVLRSIGGADMITQAKVVVETNNGTPIKYENIPIGSFFLGEGILFNKLSDTSYLDPKHQTIHTIYKSSTDYFGTITIPEKITIGVQ
jgi:hypothetical protein